MNYFVLMILIVSTSFILGAKQAFKNIPTSQSQPPLVLSATDIPTLTPTPSVIAPPSPTGVAISSTPSARATCTITVNGQTTTKSGTDCTIDQKIVSPDSSVSTSIKSSATTGGNVQSD